MYQQIGKAPGALTARSAVMLGTILVGVFTMESNLRDAAIAHAPFFITAPGQSDVLFIGVIWFVVIAIFMVGAFYLNLHALPERLAHHANHTQIQLIGILTLLALFTHNNVFWVAALVLAVIKFPDFVSPIKSIARSLKVIAQSKGGINETMQSEPVASATGTVTQENTKDV